MIPLCYSLLYVLCVARVLRHIYAMSVEAVKILNLGLKWGEKAGRFCNDQ